MVLCFKGVYSILVLVMMFFLGDACKPTSSCDNEQVCEQYYFYACVGVA